MSDLDARLLAAHAAGNKTALVKLYSEAANTTPALGPRAFYLTQAYIFALDTGHPSAPQLHKHLVDMKRDT